MANPVTQMQLMQHLNTIEESIAQANQQAASNRAENLRNDSLTYIREGSGEIPLQATLKAIKVLTKEEIQYCGTLKHQLSEISALLAEHVLTQGKDHSIYPTTRARLIGDLAIVLNWTHKTEIPTHFEVKCCLAAIHKMLPLSERAKEIAKKHAPELLKGGLASGAGLSAAPIMGPLVDVAIDSFKEGPNLWYSSLLELRREFIPVTTLDQFNDPKIQAHIEKQTTKSKYAQSLAQIFSRIIKDPQCENPLKEQVLLGEENSLKALSTQDYWKARFISIKTFTELAASPNHANHRQAIIQHLVSRIGLENKYLVHKLISQAYQSAPQEQKQEVWAPLLEARRENIQNAFGNEQTGIRHQITQRKNRLLNIETNKERIRKDIDQLGYQQQSSAGGVSFGPEPKDKKEMEAEEKKLQAEYYQIEKEVEDLQNTLSNGQEFIKQIFGSEENNE